MLGRFSNHHQSEKNPIMHIRSERECLADPMKSFDIVAVVVGTLVVFDSFNHQTKTVSARKQRGNDNLLNEC